MAVAEWGDRPLLLAVDADARQLGRIEGELQRAFGSDFRVRGELFPQDALRTLEGARNRHERVAVVLVDDSLPDDARAEIFETTNYDFETVARRLQEMAFLNKGLTITLADERVAAEAVTEEVVSDTAEAPKSAEEKAAEEATDIEAIIGGFNVAVPNPKK